MVCIHNFLLSKKQTQKQNCDRAHNARELEEIIEKSERVLEGVVALKELILMVSTLGGWGGLERTDFLQFLLVCEGSPVLGLPAGYSFLGF